MVCNLFPVFVKFLHALDELVVLFFGPSSLIKELNICDETWLCWSSWGLFSPILRNIFTLGNYFRSYFGALLGSLQFSYDFQIQGIALTNYSFRISCYRIDRSVRKGFLDLIEIVSMQHDSFWKSWMVLLPSSLSLDGSLNSQLRSHMADDSCSFYKSLWLLNDYNFLLDARFFLCTFRTVLDHRFRHFYKALVKIDALRLLIGIEDYYHTLINTDFFVRFNRTKRNHVTPIDFHWALFHYSLSQKVEFL